MQCSLLYLGLPAGPIRTPTNAAKLGWRFCLGFVSDTVEGLRSSGNGPGRERFAASVHKICIRCIHRNAFRYIFVYLFVYPVTLAPSLRMSAETV